MACKPQRNQGGVIRTYGRLRPLERIQTQTWFSPVNQKHLFSSSSSSSLLSTSHEPSSSSDPDFAPHKKKRAKACPVKKAKETAYRRGKKGRSNIPADVGEKENGPPSERNPASSLTVSTPFRKFVTVRRKAPTRCNSVKHGRRTQAQNKVQHTTISSDSTCDFELSRPFLRKKRKLCPDIRSILNSPTEISHSPLQKSPLLSSTPSVLLRAGPRARGAVGKQQILCETLEESVVRSCPKVEDPQVYEQLETFNTSEEDYEPIRSQKSRRTTRVQRLRSAHCAKDTRTGPDFISCQSNQRGVSSHYAEPRPHGKGVSQRSESCLLLSSFAPVTLSSCASQSVICLDEEHHNGVPQGPRGNSQVLYLSSELFSEDDDHSKTPSHSRTWDCVAETSDQILQEITSHEPPLVLSLMGAPLDIRSLKRMQPFVRLNADSVMQYFQSRNGPSVSLLTNTQAENHIAVPKYQAFNHTVVPPSKDGDHVTSSPCHTNKGARSQEHSARSWHEMQPNSATKCFLQSGSVTPSIQDGENLPTDPLLTQQHQGNSLDNYKPTTHQGSSHPPTHSSLCHMHMVVHLDPNSVTKYLLQRSTLPLDPPHEGNLPTPCPSDGQLPKRRNISPLLESITKTPNLAESRTERKVQSCSTRAQASVGTGRKVCISGFSAKRWGSRLKKTRTQQQLFQDSELSLRAFKELDPSMAAAQSPCSLLLSSSLWNSSFMNSSALMNMSLSPGTSGPRDPQRERGHWLRLRAALSLHRKKKVQATDPWIRPADRSLALQSPPSVNVSLASQTSSLLLLSSRCLSACADDLSDAEKVFLECQQDGPISFSSCLTQAQLALSQKIGEGAYGEVFRTCRGEQQVALKVIPIEGNHRVNGEEQKCFSEILPEIIISKELSLLNEGEENQTSGFIRLHSAHCVKGCYPPELLHAWDHFADEKGTENERPDMFNSEQLFMILEFEFGGTDLENCQLPSVVVSRSILHQVTAALAVAEEELRFEHRDLHWGNLLIEKCPSPSVTASLHGDTITIPTCGVQVKIIDYTLSRLDKDGLTVFCDLSADEELFIGHGDLQFDIYRAMREENKNVWSSYVPHSNILWLHYLADKLISAVRYNKKPSSALQRRELRKLQDFRREIRKFGSATEVLRSKLFQ
ncbi:haspin isoform X1 [Xenopus laevis]|uniref:Serine/threonine-protein kinase haspin n=1 Tax=Xenopus laevis TaxID=8355 RepID=A0A8J0U7X2_XENLA|nr:haspin isoform X1 [Xenopus laevis]XP_041421151.1 haspin isoform X1 [Xenopus laevis]OCT57706.1 hypothetical protein XELAEV_18003164mg [Xenopus laevis]